MAYINVAEWSPDQVTDWLKGLDDAMYIYVNSFANNEIKGQTLLNIRPYELHELGITSIGHQEIVLEAVEQLQNFHYDLEKENLQFLALRVATTAKNLHHQLANYPDKSKVETQILNDITRAIATIKPLVGWLDRSPFHGQTQFNEIRERILRLGIEMATSGLRDRFVENLVDQIRLTAEKLSKLADYIIQDISDPIILQPATLNLVTLKKRESEVGFNIIPNYHGIHVITDIKYNSPAQISGKIEDGDEIIQINYQTVVGWHYKRVIQQLQESPPDVLLTLKKRPRHTKIYGQIYMKPYRLPSKKRSLPYRFGDNSSSPRIEFIPSIQHVFPVLLPLTEKSGCVVDNDGGGGVGGGGSGGDGDNNGDGDNLSDSDSSSSSSILLPTESTLVKSNEKDLRLYLPKPRAVLQRRNTICGDQVFGFRGNITFWHEMNVRRNIEGNSLRDKSVSVGFGLDATKRPITCIGIHGNKEKYGDLSGALKGSLPDMKTSKDPQDAAKTTPPPPPLTSSPPASSLSAKPLPNDEVPQPVGQIVVGRTKVVKFNPAHDIIEHAGEMCKAPNDDDGEVGATVIESMKQDRYNEHSNAMALPSLPMKQKQQIGMTASSSSSNSNSSSISTGVVEAINVTLIQSKSEQMLGVRHSVRDEDKPPEIGPRNEFLKKVAPKPPPRPSKAAELVQGKFDMLRQARGNNGAAASGADPQHTGHNATIEAFNDAKKHTPKSPIVANETKVPDIITSSPLPPQNVLKMGNAAHVADDSVKSVHTPSPQKVYSKYTNSSMDSAGGTGTGTGAEESELLTPNRTKTLTLKKKNSILAKRRKICLKTLEFSDIQGHLFRRTKDKHGVTYWAKLYFVLVESALYGFRNKTSQKANCLIFLPGFTISLAKEVHSKPFAYKVYHPKKTFYFAAESEQALSQWMDYIRRATLKGNIATIDMIDRIDTRDIFSETDSSEDENDSIADVGAPSTTTSSFKHSFLGGGSKSSKKRGSIDDTASAQQQPKSEKYHLGFGSLKKFTNLHNLPFSSSKSEKEREERKKAQSDIPVPTAQFRSYRKIPGNAGMQLGGSNAMVSPMDYSGMMQHRNQQPQSLPPQSNVIPMSTSPVINDSISSNEYGPKAQHSPTQHNSQMAINYEPGAMTATPLTPSIVSAAASAISTAPSPSTPIVTVAPATIATSTPTTSKSNKSNGDPNQQSQTSQAKTFEPHFLNNKPISKLSKNKTSPFNYMHASNPNLVEFTFQTSKTLDVGLPKVNVSNTFDQHQNLQGFITLKDLMLQHEEDEANNMYNNRVNLGVEKPSDRHGKHHRKQHGRGRPSIGNEIAFNESGRSIDDDDGENTQSPSAAAPTSSSLSSAAAAAVAGAGSASAPTAVNKIQRRSLPKTPDYAQSFKADDTEIIMARSKEGQKLRDFGYEFISGDDINNGNSAFTVNNNHNHYNNNHNSVGGSGGGGGSGAQGNSNSGALITSPSGVKPTVLAKPADRFVLPTKRKGLNWIGLNLDHHKRNDDEKPIGKGSFKMTKPKHSTDWPATVDGNRTKSDAYNDAAAAVATAFHTSTPTSHTNRNESIHFSFTNGDRKASVPNSTSYLSKFVPTKTAKEKRLLGSPRLHRAASSIFGRKSVESPTTIDNHQHHQHQNFTQFDPFPTKYGANIDYGSSMNAAAATGNCSNDTITSRYDSFNEIAGTTSPISTTASNFVPTLAQSLASDQNTEYPPVWIGPETYSLRDPNVTH